MKIRKGPFGQFATTTISSDKEIYNYAEEVINAGYYKELLPVYIDSYRNNVEVSFDFSGYTTINEFKLAITKNKNRIARRISLRDFFLSLSKYASTCVFPDSLILDTNYVYTDESGETIKFCMLPVKKDCNELSLKAVNHDNFEQFLSHPFINEVLSNDEKQEILFSITHNDIKRLTNTAMKMDESYFKAAKKATPPSLSTKLMCLLGAAVFCITALYFALCRKTDFSYLCMSFTGIMLVLSYTPKESTTTITSSNSSRKEILFDNSQVELKDTIPPLFLKSETEISGKPFQYAMFTNRTVIGSDCFLSDIVFDYLGIDYVQAEILQKNNSYYLVSKSNNYPTFLEHRKLVPDKEYEIKDGQVLTVGDIELTISIGFN